MASAAKTALPAVKATAAATASEVTPDRLSAPEHASMTAVPATALRTACPADDKLNTRLIVSDIIVETLKDLKMSYPETTAERRKELHAIRKQLA